MVRGLTVPRLAFVTLWFYLVFASVFSAQPGSINLTVILEDEVPKIFEGVDLVGSLNSLFSSDLPGDVLRIVHVLRIEKESYSYKTNEFFLDPRGSYIRFMGQYYYTSARTRYRYDQREKKYVPDKDGPYVYVPEFAWARKDDDKYIMSSFYSRREELVSRTVYRVLIYLTEIDATTLYVRRAVPIVASGATLLEALRSSRNSLTPQAGKFSEYKYDVAVVFERNVDLFTRALVTSSIQKEIRFNVFDRTYLNEIFERARFRDLTGHSKTGIRFRPAKFILNFTNFVTTYSENEEVGYVFIHNPFNGRYIKRHVNGTDVPVPVEVGNFYTYDREKKAYKLDREKGIYVRYYGGPWETETYVTESSFYEYFLLTTKTLRRWTNVLLNIVDVQSGEIVGSKRLEVLESRKSRNVNDLYGSEEVWTKFSVEYLAASSVAKQALDFSTKVLRLSTYVEAVSENVITFASGENAGIKPDMAFRVVFDGYTVGFARVERTQWESAKGLAYYVVPGEALRPFSILEEERTHRYPSNQRTVLIASPWLTTISVEALFVDLNGFPSWGLGLGYAVLAGRYPLYGEYALPNEAVFSLFFNDAVQLRASAVVVPEDIWIKPYLLLGLTFSTFARSSVFTNSGAGLLIHVGILADFSRTIDFSPYIALGLEVR